VSEQAEEKKEKKNNATLVKVEIIAQIFGVTVRRVQQLTQEGIIQTVEVINEDNRKVRRYDLIPTITKYIAYLSEKAYGKANRSEKEIELREQKMQADLALKESQGELHRLKTQIMVGEYISIEEVKLDYAKFFVIYKKFATSIPSRVSGMISGSVEPLEAKRIEKDISGEITTLLQSFVVAGVASPKDVRSVLSEAKKMEKEVSAD
jgi:phage terminase Nu1 subunit (DNA packaging protein)